MGRLARPRFSFNSRVAFPPFSSLLTLLSLLSLFAPSAHADKLVLKEEAYVKGPKVLLGELAKIDGDNAAALAQVEISLAPLPGDTKQLNAALVATRLENAGFDTSDVQIEGAPKVRATTLHLEVTPAQLSESLRDYIGGAMPWAPQDALIDVQQPQGTFRVPDGDLQIEWTPNPQYRYVGPGAFRATVMVDGAAQKTVLVKANVDAYAQVLVARRDIQRGMLVSTADLMLQKVSLTLAPDDALTQPGEALGRVARKTILAGQTVTLRALDLPVLVQRNQVVPVEVRTGNVLVQGQARALTEGRVGDAVICANLESKERFQGVVRPDGVVAVE